MRVNIFAAICGNYRQNNQQGFSFKLYIPYQGNDKSHNLLFTGKKETKLPTIAKADYKKKDVWNFYYKKRNQTNKQKMRSDQWTY